MGPPPRMHTAPEDDPGESDEAIVVYVLVADDNAA
jgi:hypothetical protein